VCVCVDVGIVVVVVGSVSVLSLIVCVILSVVECCSGREGRQQCSAECGMGSSRWLDGWMCGAACIECWLVVACRSVCVSCRLFFLAVVCNCCVMRVS